MQQHEHLSDHGIIRNVFQPFSILFFLLLFRRSTVQAKSCLALELGEMYSTSVFQYLCVWVGVVRLTRQKKTFTVSKELIYSPESSRCGQTIPTESFHAHSNMSLWNDTLISPYISLLFYLLSQWVIDAKLHWGFVTKYDGRFNRCSFQQRTISG